MYDACSYKGNDEIRKETFYRKMKAAYGISPSVDIEVLLGGGFKSPNWETRNLLRFDKTTWPAVKHK
jgi:hypothetical protein